MLTNKTCILLSIELVLCKCWLKVESYSGNEEIQSQSINSPSKMIRFYHFWVKNRLHYYVGIQFLCYLNFFFFLRAFLQIKVVYFFGKV